ncbi:GGDEF domain-containing protein [Dyella humicola]|uniref:GGDEF domain-containing protein n=1 Tax=Dyella humicola TaxID=2992126 RepID=UPI0022560329|nr:GGDEF domain-containing protein [Dyella humicola]
MPDKAPASDSINRRFRHIVIVIYVVVLSLVLMLFVQQWLGYRDAAQARTEFDVLQAALRAMASISAERQRTFTVLEQQIPTTSQQIATLEATRRAVDARLDELGVTLRNPGCGTCASLITQYDQMRTNLADARRELDAVGREDPDDRSEANILRAFDPMVGTIPTLSSIADTTATGVIRENADVQSYLLTARLAGLLREHAGLLGSKFLPSLIHRRALTEDETFGIAQTLGRIDQLRMLIGPSIHGLPAHLQADFFDVSQRYFGEGRSYIDDLRSSAMQPSGAGITAMQFVDRYIPLMTSIDSFRDASLALADKTIRASLRRHIALLVGAGLLASALTGVLLIMMWRFREKIVRPFVEARRLILAIASGNLAVAIPAADYSGEVKDLFGALDILKQNSAERVRLEGERKRLIGELRTMAETDALTGLSNRRAFTTKATTLLQDKRRTTPYVALVMFDIDHFKRINDTYGHETGDRALVMLSALCRDTLRADDIIARIGGEEFAILLCVDHMAQARELTERMRSRLHQEPITAVSGAVFQMTVSFGIAIELRANEPDLDAFLRRADTLLYRAKENGRDRIEADDEP